MLFLLIFIYNDDSRLVPISLWLLFSVHIWTLNFSWEDCNKSPQKLPISLVWIYTISRITPFLLAVKLNFKCLGLVRSYFLNHKTINFIGMRTHISGYKFYFLNFVGLIHSFSPKHSTKPFIQMASHMNIFRYLPTPYIHHSPVRIYFLIIFPPTFFQSAAAGWS